MKKQFFVMAFLCLSGAFISCSEDDEVKQQIEKHEEMQMVTTSTPGTGGSIETGGQMGPGKPPGNGNGDDDKDKGKK